ncbi:XRE family transcriptional regulator [Roseovarius halotolerans]|uniref:HTH-type transcriptional regulator PuuR n=1 Tax=Roseovarius halotolerans TaxID=505353 RepID=A0A1X6ZXW8_9RHOB|nr:cupin domain-containing protein [Roseovarius halotolerans]RKT27718.1 XRE family transcriptional regulator [Roseovarius halotolerans]SLN64751.1 HTH-type transcriptional regulator PuuR [Roseovarius halotolerans]
MAKIGTNLKHLRHRRHLSTRELANRSGVSHATISLIERDKISPTIDTLQAVLDALGSRLSEFLSGIREGGTSPFYLADELPEIGNPENISYKIIGLNHPYRSIQFLRETYSIGADSGEMLTHVAQEAGYIMSGEVELTVGQATRVLKKGDGYYFDSREFHRFRNVGTTKAEIVSAISPPSY